MQYKKQMERFLLKTAVPTEANRIRKENKNTIPPTKHAFNKLGFNIMMAYNCLNYLQVF